MGKRPVTHPPFVWIIQISSWLLLVNWSHLCPCNSNSLFTEKNNSLCYWQPSNLKSNFVAKTALRSRCLFWVQWDAFHYQLDRKPCKCKTYWECTSCLLWKNGETQGFFRLIDPCPSEKPSGKMHFNLLLNSALCLGYLRVCDGIDILGSTLCSVP